MPSKFTLTQLQRTYEIVLGKSLDKRNFRKKILAGSVSSRPTSAISRAGTVRPGLPVRLEAGISNRP